MGCPCPAGRSWRGAGLEISPARLNLSGLPPETQGYLTFKQWQPRKELASALTSCKLYCLNPQARPFLLLVGPPGVGKTHLVVAMAWELLESGFLVTYRQVGRLLDNLRTLPRFCDEGLPPYSREVQFLEQVPVLILDDIGQQREGWEFLDSLIDFSYLCRRPTVVTSNLAKDRLPPRLVSRFSDKQLSRLIVIKAADFRQKGGP